MLPCMAWLFHFLCFFPLSLLSLLPLSASPCAFPAPSHPSRCSHFAASLLFSVLGRITLPLLVFFLSNPPVLPGFPLKATFPSRPLSGRVRFQSLCHFAHPESDGFVRDCVWSWALLYQADSMNPWPVLGH